MDIVIKTEVGFDLPLFLSKINNGSMFIYPTDTIYGIGCDATNKEAVQKLRDVKERPERPFSIIAPSKDWIRKNCYTDEKVEAWLEKLPGPYTLILKLANKDAIAPEVNNGGSSIGVRMPGHWITEMVQHLEKPIVTTSANVSNHMFMTSLGNLEIEIMNETDFIIYEGEKRGRPSTIIDLCKTEEMVLRR